MLRNRGTYDAFLDLTKLNRKQESDDYSNFFLNDDIWDKNRLIMKSGNYLTDEIIDKLLNFGIKEIKVGLNETDDNEVQAEDSFVKSSINDFIRTQSVLIVKESLYSAGALALTLKNQGFADGNIFITRDANSINKYFRVKKINFLFIDSNSYEKCPKCVTKYSLLKNMHVFVLMKKDETARKIKTSSFGNVKFLSFPFDSNSFGLAVNRAISQNYLNQCLSDDDNELVS